MVTQPSEPTPESSAKPSEAVPYKAKSAPLGASQVTPAASSGDEDGTGDEHLGDEPVLSDPSGPPGIGAQRVEKTMIESAQDRDTGATDCYECLPCSYVYEPLKGDSRKASPGTSFDDLPVNWRCPVCSAPKSQFVNVGPKGTPSGFKENLNYGFGVNAMTPGQKNVLIFGSLLTFFLIFLSLYGLG